MTTAVDARKMRKLADALSQAGIPTRNPSGGSLFGTLQMAGSSLFLRFDVSGDAFLYDHHQGTPNHRIPLGARFKIDLRAADWKETLVASVRDVLHQPTSTTRPHPWKCVIDPHGHPISGLYANGETGEFAWDPLPNGTPRPIRLKSRNSLNLYGGAKSALNMAEAVLRTFVGSAPPGQPYAAFINECRVYPHDYAVTNLRWQAKRQVIQFPTEDLPHILSQWASGGSAADVATLFNTTQSHVHNIIEGQDSTGSVLMAHLDPMRRQALAYREVADIPDDPPAARLRARLHPKP